MSWRSCPRIYCGRCGLGFDRDIFRVLAVSFLTLTITKYKGCFYIPLICLTSLKDNSVIFFSEKNIGMWSMFPSKVCPVVVN